jgi:ribonuclease Z
MFGVTILGSNSAQPAYNRHPAAQVVTLNNHQFLIDCGEGTQMQMASFKVKKSRIQYIFISHLHGDHYFGLPGLLNSMALSGRTLPVYLFAPAPLQELLNSIFKAAGTILPFELIFQPLQEGVLLNTDQFSFECFEVAHRIECFGCVVREKKRPRKLDVSKANQYFIPSNLYESLTAGDDVVLADGTHILNDWVTKPAPQPRSYAYTADTSYYPEIIERIKNVTLLYHETTYLAEDREKAIQRFHSTTEDAAAIAKAAGVHQLLIGHFSSKYENLNEFLTQAHAIFPNTELAIEGTTFRIMLPYQPS